MHVDVYKDPHHAAGRAVGHREGEHRDFLRPSNILLLINMNISLLHNKS